MRTKIIITYNWNDGSNGTVAKNHLETLDNIAEMNIREQMEKGFTSGDLEANLFDEDFSGHWSRTTERVDENAPTIQEQVDERAKEYEKEYQKRKDALEVQYQEKFSQINEKEVKLDKIRNQLESDYKEKTENKLKEYESNYQKKESNLEYENRVRSEELDAREEVYLESRQAETNAVEIWQYGADLNLGSSCTVARYPNGYTRDIPENGYRIILGLYQGEVLELIANSETMKQLMNNTRKIEPLTEEEFKEKFINS